MSLLVPWSLWRPHEPVPPCPRCGHVTNNAVVFMRHELNPEGDHGPAWMHCDGCRRWWSPGVWRRHEVESSEPWTS